MAGELTDLDAVVRFGHPWHGLCRNGTITLPNATTRAAVTAPLDGECFVIKVPEQPAVTTSAEDTALGMAWLNYAVVSGRNHVLYGKALLNNRFVYVAPDKTAWVITLAGNYGYTLNVQAAPINGGTTTQNDWYALTPAMAGGLAPTVVPKVIDVSSDGAKVMIAYVDVAHAGRVEVHQIRGVALLVLSATPPAMTAALTLILGGGVGSLSGFEEAEGNYESKTLTETRILRRLVGGVYEYLEESRSLAWDGVTIPAWSVTAGGWMVWHYPKVRRTEVTSRRDVSQTMSFCFSVTDAPVAVKLRSFNEKTGFGNEFETDQMGTIIRDETVGAELGFAQLKVGSNLSPELTGGSTAIIKYSNRLYGARIGGAPSTYHPPLAPDHTASGASISASVQPVATYHPVTGQIIFEAAGDVTSFV